MAALCWLRTAGTHFTRFAGTKVQILTQKAFERVAGREGQGQGFSYGPQEGSQFACFTGTKVQILTQLPEGEQTRDYGARA